MKMTRELVPIHGKDGVIVMEKVSFLVYKGEPVFVLRGQDITAANKIDAWAFEAKKVGAPAPKTKEAHKIADEFRAWPNRKVPD